MEITLAGHPPVVVSVGVNGFFIADLPDEVSRSLLVEPTTSVEPVGPVRALDAADRVLATSR
ncbi:MAG: hypothetical protein M3179_08845 [Actinomycetota bacterium]|nr:hypothetical protein [Actinomycetota bacterium]